MFRPFAARDLTSSIEASFHLGFCLPLDLFPVSCHFSLRLAILLSSILYTYPAHFIIREAAFSLSGSCLEPFIADPIIPFDTEDCSNTFII